MCEPTGTEGFVCVRIIFVRSLRGRKRGGMESQVLRPIITELVVWSVDWLAERIEFRMGK